MPGQRGSPAGGGATPVGRLVVGSNRGKSFRFPSGRALSFGLDLRLRNPDISTARESQLLAGGGPRRVSVVDEGKNGPGFQKVIPDGHQARLFSAEHNVKYGTSDDNPGNDPGRVSRNRGHSSHFLNKPGRERFPVRECQRGVPRVPRYADADIERIAVAIQLVLLPLGRNTPLFTPLGFCHPDVVVPDKGYLGPVRRPGRAPSVLD